MNHYYLLLPPSFPFLYEDAEEEENGGIMAKVPIFMGSMIMRGGRNIELRRDEEEVGYWGG